jgi:dTDP-4-amino-4,6-dideoxygalactose transaminase
MSGLTIPFTGLRKQYNNLRIEILDVTDTVLRSGQLMSGNYTTEFENWLAQKNKSQYAITCHSGTQALEIIADYYRQDVLVPNPTVLIPALTYVATANAWQRAGWEIVIVDTDNYGIMSLEKIPRTFDYQAVCIVGLYGAAIPNAWRNQSKFIIEDGAQHWLSANCERQGKATAISFDPTKNFSNYGNGGAVVTNDLILADFARNQCRNSHASMNNIGTNSRMSEIDCAQLMVKTKYIDKWQKRREEIAKHWMDRLNKSPVRTLIDKGNVDRHCYHKFVIEVNNRDILQRNLDLRKIETKIHYKDPIQDLPAYQQCNGPDMMSASHALSRRCLSLPIYPELTDLEVEYVIDSVLACV